MDDRQRQRDTGEKLLDWGRRVMDPEIHFVTKLTMTSAGKIMRGGLRREEIRKIETKESRSEGRRT